jgi:hypothetical protein
MRVTPAWGELAVAGLQAGLLACGKALHEGANEIAVAGVDDLAILRSLEQRHNRREPCGVGFRLFDGRHGRFVVLVGFGGEAREVEVFMRDQHAGHDAVRIGKHLVGIDAHVLGVIRPILLVAVPIRMAGRGELIESGLAAVARYGGEARIVGLAQRGHGRDQHRAAIRHGVGSGLFVVERCGDVLDLGLERIARAIARLNGLAGNPGWGCPARRASPKPACAGAMPTGNRRACRRRSSPCRCRRSDSRRRGSPRRRAAVEWEQGERFRGVR